MKIKIFYILITGIAIIAGSCSQVVHLAPPKRSCEEALTGWTISRPNFPTTVLQNDLIFIDDMTGFSVGNSGTILKTTDRGQDWEIQEQFYLPDGHLNPGGLTKAHLKAVYFIDAFTGYAGGQGEHSYIDQIHTDAVFLKTNDGGEHWQKRFLSNVTEIYDLVFFDEDRGMGIFDVDTTSNIHVMETGDGGKTWNIIPNRSLNEFHFIRTPERLLYVAENELGIISLFSTSDNGQSWESNPLPTGVFGRIHFTSDQAGFVTANDLIYPSGVLQTKDGGVTWHPSDIPLEPWSILHFNSPEEGFIITPQFIIIQSGGEQTTRRSYFEVHQTEDAGETWTIANIDDVCNLEGKTFSATPDLLFLSGSDFFRFEKN